VVQINVQEFKYYWALKAYLIEQNADIVCMQEVWSGFFSFEEWKSEKTLWNELWYTGVIWKNVQSIWDKNSYRGNAIFSKYPIIESSTDYLPVFWSKIERDIKKDIGWLDPLVFEERKKIWTYWQTVPFPVTSCLIQLPSWILCCCTVHFPASPKCAETGTMNLCSDYILESLSHKKDYPILLTWDFNIQANAWCITSLKKKFNHVNTEHTNTLNKSVHPWFKNDIPESGYMVDHIFATWLTVKNWRVDTVTISDHYPVLVEFNLSE
jgi:endonuclease/exonuclease/phosphatase family metal-dependent hydrolase